MEDLNKDKKDTFFAIAYHMSDSFSSSCSGDTRYSYYGRPEYQGGIPLSVINGTFHRFDAPTSGSLYEEFLAFYNQAQAVPAEVDISLSLLEFTDRVQVQVTNSSTSSLQGTLHLVLVERHRPYEWRDMQQVDFICRSQTYGHDGQRVTLPSLQTFTSVQNFSLQPDWNYCSIVAFFQKEDQGIAQAAVIEIGRTFPVIQMNGAPHFGDLVPKGSTYQFSWSSSRPLPFVTIEYSTDGGFTWKEIEKAEGAGGTCRWVVPEIYASRCLLAVRDAYAERQAVSGLFSIGIRGDFNEDGAVNSADRDILIDHLVENKATSLVGADLNRDGTIDLFDLLEFDVSFGQ